MAEAKSQENEPPKLRRTESGEVDTNSLADLLEWFLMYDERTARMRHANTRRAVSMESKYDEQQGIVTYPFENAEARFAVGTFQALAENNTGTAVKTLDQRSARSAAGISQNKNRDRRIV